MKGDNTTITTLRNLLDYDAGKFINAEVQLKNSLPGWIIKASSLNLKSILQQYLEFVQVHIDRIDSFIDEEKINSLHLHNGVMEALINDMEAKLEICHQAEIKDASMLASIQAINHFKICIYGTAAAFANALGMEKYGFVFHEAEENEKLIDEHLSHLAEHEINNSARATILLPV